MYYSPLRYPGGKTKFLPLIENIIKHNNLFDHEYVEPYAGGAGVAIGLLTKGLVKKIHINDYDYAIYSFWKACIQETEDFIQLIKETPVTVEEWHKQRSIYLNNTTHSILESGFATFFLNRTNHSGILKGRMIGGYEQKGNWGITCRFNKEALIKRIENIALHRHNISIYNQDTLDLLNQLESRFDKYFYYLDPPYYVKGYQLYRNFYTDEDHKKIAETLSRTKSPWFVSYDDHPRINELYKDYKQGKTKVVYSTGQTKQAQEIIIYSDNLLDNAKMLKA
jgi:DNA adenine methylase